MPNVNKHLAKIKIGAKEELTQKNRLDIKINPWARMNPHNLTSSNIQSK